MEKTKRVMLEFGERSLEFYKKLNKELTGSFGKSLANREQFFIAMSWGFKHGLAVEDFKRVNTGVRLDYLRDEDHALMAAVQLATTQDLDSLLDLDQRYELAEQYAEGGIQLLGKMMDEPGDFARTFAAEVREFSASLA